MARKKLNNWEKQDDHKDFIYLRIPKDIWNEWEEKELQGKAPSVSFSKLKSYRVDYKWKMEKKAKSANEATKIKKARSDMKIYKALERLYSSLLKTDNGITIYKLAKEAGVSYPKAKKFWNEYNLDKWLPLFEKNNGEALKEFLYKELSESLVWDREKKKN